MRGSKHDMSKRQATLQICVRPEGEQIMPPVIIFKNLNPWESAFDLPEGLDHEITFNDNGKRKRGKESNFYDPRVLVAWQEKAWADEPFCLEYIKKFHNLTKSTLGSKQKLRSLQQDNLSAQCTDDIKSFAFKKIFFFSLRQTAHTVVPSLMTALDGL